MLSGGRSRITSARCRSGSSSRRKPSKLSGSLGTSRGGSLMLFPPMRRAGGARSCRPAISGFRRQARTRAGVVIGEARTPAPGVERIGLDRAAALDESGDPLDPSLVRQAGDGHLGDGRMQRQMLSIPTGETFSPPQRIMSSTRSVTNRFPSASTCPVSPVKCQPPRKARASASGWRR
jgi:hypothetical protein